MYSFAFARVQTLGFQAPGTDAPQRKEVEKEKKRKEKKRKKGKEKKEKKRRMMQNGKSAAPGLPAWSPTAVLPRLEPA